MAANNPDRDSIFCAAIDIPSEEERAAYVAGACGDDAVLRREVEKLIAAHFQAVQLAQAEREEARRELARKSEDQ